MLLKYGKVISRPCSFCKLHDEIIVHLFHDCLIVKRIWNQLKSIISNNLNFPISASQSAIFGFWDLDTNEHLVLNHLLLVSGLRQGAHSKYTFTIQRQQLLECKSSADTC